jgi:hypothetical protein
MINAEKKIAKSASYEIAIIANSAKVSIGICESDEWLERAIKMFFAPFALKEGHAKMENGSQV